MAHRQPNFDLKKVEKTPPPKKQLDITAEETKEIKTRIQDALEQQKVFLNPTLNAQELAKQIHTSKRKLSYVINHKMNRTFRDLINEYRVEEVKMKLKTQQDSHLSILGIALDCGFNSEASFYRIFKKVTGVSPREFVRASGDLVEL